MKVISKEFFIDIMNDLKNTDETVDEIHNVILKSKNEMIRNFLNSEMVICHTDIVTTLLDFMFDSGDMISWWVYELEYGKKYEKGCIQDANGNDIDVSTVEKLYDYLVGEKE